MCSRMTLRIMSIIIEIFRQKHWKICKISSTTTLDLSIVLAGTKIAVYSLLLHCLLNERIAHLERLRIDGLKKCYA